MAVSRNNYRVALSVVVITLMFSVIVTAVAAKTGDQTMIVIAVISWIINVALGSFYVVLRRNRVAERAQGYDRSLQARRYAQEFVPGETDSLWDGAAEELDLADVTFSDEEDNEDSV